MQSMASRTTTPTGRTGRIGRSRAGSLAGLAAGALLGLALLTGCGSESDDAENASDDTSSSTPTESGTETSQPTSEPSQTPTSAPPTSEAVPPGTPACADVWTAGAVLPRTYSGCADGETYVPADKLGCSSGQRLVRYADRFYAIAGSDISEADGPLMKDKDYGSAAARCRA